MGQEKSCILSCNLMTFPGRGHYHNRTPDPGKPTLGISGVATPHQNFIFETTLLVAVFRQKAQKRLLLINGLPWSDLLYNSPMYTEADNCRLHVIIMFITV